MKILLLFDIDGTLVDTEGAGLKALEEGFFEAFPDCRGRNFPSLDLGGATDAGVAAFLLDHFEIENTSGNRAAFFLNYTNHLEVRLQAHRDKGKGRVLPGVVSLLENLPCRFPGHTSALLTGNTKKGAEIKLQHYGLNRFFEFGAFGCDHSDRNRLGHIAIERAAESSGRSIQGDDVVIIGDTLKDIACARACGANVLAVATGAASAEELKAAKPDALLSDFSNLEKTFVALESIFSSATSR
ncbi:MAG: HAD hydrolase-like protein [Verrucomicrobiales bacterium]|nr:HAD hydrolase-like protein [Verrucomicrobiales bacterium]